MAEKYYSIITNRGKVLEAASSAKGTPVIIKDFVVGDGNGMAITPDPARTTLVHEVFRTAISKLEVSPDQANQWIAHLVIPASVGGFTVREVGLLTDAGELYAVANCAAIEKPQSGVSVSLQFRLAVSETANIELKVATGDGLFLRQDANLSDVNDKVQSRKNLELKGAALLDVGKNKGTVAAGDDSRIVNALNKTDGGTVTGAVLIVHTLSISAKPTGVFADPNMATFNIGDSDTGFVYPADGMLDVYANNARVFRWNIKDGYSYSDLTFRSKGEIQTESVNSYRIAYGGRGVFARFDGSNWYLMFTKDGDPYGGYNDLRPIRVDYSSGMVTLDCGLTVSKGARAIGMQEDGNIVQRAGASIFNGYWNATNLNDALRAITTAVSNAQQNAINWTAANIPDLIKNTNTGAVGGYAFLRNTVMNQTIEPGTLVNGGQLQYSGITAYGGGSGGDWARVGDGGSPGGTWRCMGRCYNSDKHYGACLWLRVA